MTEPLCPNCERLTNAGTPPGDEQWCWAARLWGKRWHSLSAGGSSGPVAWILL